MRPRARLLLQLVAVAAAAAALQLAIGVPLLAARELRPEDLMTLAAAEVVLVVVVGWLVLGRSVGRPIERLLAAAARLGEGQPGLPPLGPPEEAGTGGLSRAAVAFERTAAALAEERARLAAKVAELERANAQLGRAREELLASERLATVGQLAAGVAHEIGNPLGAVVAYAELGRSKLGGAAPDAASAADYLARIAAEAQRIDGIVRELLDFARPARLELGPVRLEEALDAALRLARVQGRFGEVRVALALDPALPPVRADARRLSQVFLNLLLNAGDAMGGQGEVEIGAAAADGRVRVRVRDRGPGIAPEALPRLFDPFFTTKAPGRGTGLGLAVCFGIVESFGGRIEAGNAAGGGAVFTLDLAAA